MGPCHTVVELGEQAQLDTRRRESRSESFGTTTTKDVPCSDADPTGERRGRIGAALGDLTETWQLGQQVLVDLVRPQLIEPVGALLEARRVHAREPVTTRRSLPRYVV
jgi:hypothetical protein